MADEKFELGKETDELGRRRVELDVLELEAQ
jgi:hypothetical protein